MEDGKSPTLLDSFETKRLETNPALKLLTWYGINFLIARVGYSIVLPIFTNAITIAYSFKLLYGH